jgi:hypothetical protein
MGTFLLPADYDLTMFAVYPLESASMAASDCLQSIRSRKCRAAVENYECRFCQRSFTKHYNLVIITRHFNQPYY